MTNKDLMCVCNMCLHNTSCSKKPIDITQITTLKKAIQLHGEILQQLVAIEEMGELIQAIVKNLRNPNKDTKENLAEEIADVYIMLKQLEIIHNNDTEVAKNIEYKIERLANRILSEIQRGEEK